MTDLKRSSAVRRAATAGQARLVLGFAFIALLFAAVGVFHAATHVSVVRAGYELKQAEARHAALLRENEHLKLERATLRSAPRLEAIARARLGLVPPSASQIVAVKAAPAASPSRSGPAVAAVTRPAPAARRNP